MVWIKRKGKRLMEKWQEAAGSKWVRLILITAGVYAGMRFLLPLVYPFLLAALFVIPMYPWLKRVENRTHIGRGFLTSGILFFFGAVCILLVWAVVAWAGGHVSKLVNGLELFEKNFGLFVSDCCELVEVQTGLQADDIETVILERVNIFIEDFEVNVIPRLMKHSVGFVGSAARTAAGIMVAFIGAVLLAKDYELIQGKLSRMKGYERAAGILGSIGHLVGTFFRAQVIILGCISILAAAGLFIARIGHPIGLGILAGLMDALPFIGTGIVLMPLAFWQLIQGRYIQAVACVALYTVCALLRELLEPRLIGGRIGLYPVIVLAAVYVGVRVYGLGGVILGPLSLLLIREIWRVWK